MTGTVGQLLVLDGLPESLREEARAVGPLDKGGVSRLLALVARKTPEQYGEVLRHLLDVGRSAAQATGANSVRPRDLLVSANVRKFQQRVRAEVQQIAEGDLDDDEKDRRITAVLQRRGPELQKLVLADAEAAGNPLFEQVRSGSRGNPSNLRSLLGGDVMYADAKGRPIPVPILKSYAQGLSPLEYYASTFGARAGVVAEKLGVARGGYTGKQLAQAAHRLVVVGDDDPDRRYDPALPVGLPSDPDDPANVGALLAHPAGGHPRDTLLTSHVLADLRNRGVGRILVRSPVAGGPAEGVWAKDLGHRERGRLPYTGEAVGLQAASAISEKLTQANLSAKHAGGVAGANAVSGYARIDQLLNPPRTFRGGAAHAQVDGRVEEVRDAPQGGTYVTVAGHRHHAPHGLAPKVKPGDDVEAGDVLSEGTPNPAEVVRHKGIGEGRRYLTAALVEAYQDAGIPASRRNVELIARGVADRVEATEPFGDHSPGDLVSYSKLAATYTPRDGHRVDRPEHLRNHYLERPVLHYSVGTRLTPSVVKTLKEFGIDKVPAHPDPPPFKPAAVRAVDALASDEDWMTRMLGSGLKKGLLKAVHRGGHSDEAGTSYVPGLARGVAFADGTGKIKPFHPGGPRPEPPGPGGSVFARLTGVDKSSAERPDPFAGFQVMYPAGSSERYCDEADYDDDDYQPEWPKELTFPVDYGPAGDHWLFSGSDPKGHCGYLTVRLPDFGATERKYFRRLADPEFVELVRELQPILVGRPAVLDSEADLAEAALADVPAGADRVDSET